MVSSERRGYLGLDDILLLNYPCCECHGMGPQGGGPRRTAGWWVLLSWAGQQGSELMPIGMVLNARGQPGGTWVSCCHLGWWSSISWVLLGLLFSFSTAEILQNLREVQTGHVASASPSRGATRAGGDLKSQAVPTRWLLGFTPYFFQAGVGDLSPLCQPHSLYPVTVGCRIPPWDTAGCMGTGTNS